MALELSDTFFINCIKQFNIKYIQLRTDGYQFHVVNLIAPHDNHNLYNQNKHNKYKYNKGLGVYRRHINFASIISLVSDVLPRDKSSFSKVIKLYIKLKDI